MLAISRYDLRFDTDVAEVLMHRGAEICKVTVIRGIPAIFAAIDTTSPPVVRRIKAVATGFVVPEDATYLDSLQMYMGPVESTWHLFDLGERP